MTDSEKACIWFHKTIFPIKMLKKKKAGPRQDIIVILASQYLLYIFKTTNGLEAAASVKTLYRIF